MKQAIKLALALSLTGGLFASLLPALAGPSLVPYKPEVSLPYRGFHPDATKPLAMPDTLVNPIGTTTSLLSIAPGMTLLSLDKPGKFFRWTPRVAQQTVKFEPLAWSRNWQQAQLSDELGMGRYALGYFSLKPLLPLSEKTLEGSLVQFQIDSGIFWQQLQQSLTGIAFHRSGQRVGSKRLGLVIYGGHLSDALPGKGVTLPGNQIITTLNLTGGWYEGDTYEKQLSTNALVASQLLRLFQDNPQRFTRASVQTPTAASGNDRKMPPIVREALVGLRWLQAMQREDGTFYSAVTADEPLPNYTPPSSDTRVRYARPPQLESSLLATAAFAKASRAYQEVSVSGAVEALRFAERGWTAIQPRLTAYSDLSQAEQEALFFVIVELTAATEKPIYSQWLNGLMQYWLTHPQALRQSLASSQVMNEATWTLLAHWPEGLQRAEWTTTFREALLSLSRGWLLEQTVHPWSIPVHDDEALSAPDLLYRAQILLEAYQLSDVAALKEAAWRTYAYVLGVNPWRTALITGDLGSTLNAGPKEDDDADDESQATGPEPVFDEFSKERPTLPLTPVPTIESPCHALSAASSRPLPGLLVHGPTTAALLETPLPRLNDSDTACIDNRATLRHTALLAEVAGLLNEAYNAIESTELDAEAKAEQRGYKLPPIRSRGRRR